MSIPRILKACSFFVLFQSVPICKGLQEERVDLEERVGIAFSKGFVSLCAFVRESTQLGHAPKGYFFKDSSNSVSWSFEALPSSASFYECDTSKCPERSVKLLLVKDGLHSQNKEEDCHLLKKELAHAIFTVAISDCVPWNRQTWL